MKNRIPPSIHSRSDNSQLLYIVIVIVLCLLAGITTAQVKTSTVNGNWNNPATWSPYGVPASSDKIFIYHDVTLNQNFAPSDTIFVFNVLNLGSNSVLTLTTGMMVLVNNTTYDGRIGTVANGGNISGNFIFQKWISRCDGFSMYGSPFNVSTSDFNWYYCYQCMPNWSNIYYYDETVAGNLNLGYYDAIGGSIQRGKGFSYWYSNYSGGPNFSRQISLRGSINFTSDFDFNITRTASTGNSDDGYNLLANPFPGTIDWLSGDWTKKKIVDAIYVWNTCTGTYASFVGGVGVNGGSRYIPSMQAFWVQANQNNPQLKIGNGALTSTSLSLQRTASNKDTIAQVLRLTFNGDEIAIRLDSGASSGLDSLKDALKFFSDASSICSSVKSGTTDFSINSVKDTDIVISIKTRGSGTLDFNGVNTFPGVYTIRLKDLKTNLSQPVTEGMQYNFVDTSLVTFQERFEIQFTRAKVTGIKNETMDIASIRYDQENIFIKLSSDTQLPVSITVYDLSGRLVYNGVAQQTETVLQRNGLPVVVRMQNQNGFMTKKVF